MQILSPSGVLDSDLYGKCHGVGRPEARLAFPGMTDKVWRDRSSVRELLGRAVGILVTAAGPIHERLIEAWTEVVLAHRYIDSLPAPVADYLATIWNTLDGASSIDGLTVADAQHLARMIYELHGIVEDYEEDDDARGEGEGG